MMYIILAVVIYSSDNTTAGLVNQKKLQLITDR